MGKRKRKAPIVCLPCRAGANWLEIEGVGGRGSVCGGADEGCGKDSFADIGVGAEYKMRA